MPECIFCGARNAKLTREDILSKWVSGVLLDLRPSGVGFEVEINRTPKPYQTKSLDLSPRVLCAPCNGGWMAGLDGTVKPILEPLIGGQARSLSRRQQRAISTWVVAKLMVAEFLAEDENNNFFTVDERRVLREKGELPDGVGVLIAQYAGTQDALLRGEVRGWTTDEFPGSIVPGAVACYGAGHLLILLVAQRFLEDESINQVTFHAKAPGGVVPIWPVQSRQKWPPQPAVSDAQLERFFESFGKTIETFVDAPP